MHVVLSFSKGQPVEAVLLGVGRSRLRLAVPGYNDALELELIGSQWTTEDGEAVSIDAITRSASMDCSELLTDLPARAFAAGRS